MVSWREYVARTVPSEDVVPGVLAAREIPRTRIRGQFPAVRRPALAKQARTACETERTRDGCQVLEQPAT